MGRKSLTGPANGLCKVGTHAVGRWVIKGKKVMQVVENIGCAWGREHRVN